MLRAVSLDQEGGILVLGPSIGAVGAGQWRGKGRQFPRGPPPELKSLSHLREKRVLNGTRYTNCLQQNPS